MPGTSHFATRLWSRREIRYVLVAGCTATFYMASFGILLQLDWQYFAAILISQAITASLAFPAYRGLVFRSTGRLLGDVVRFLGVWMAGAASGLIGTPALVELAGFRPWWAQLTAIAAVGVMSYLGQRFVAFRSQTSERSTIHHTGAQT